MSSDVFQITWDEYSLMINGERVFLFSGEMHPYRYIVFSSMFSDRLRFLLECRRNHSTWIYSRKSKPWVSIQFRSMCSGVSWSLSGAKSLSRDSETYNPGLMPQNKLASTSWLGLVSIDPRVNDVASHLLSE